MTSTSLSLAAQIIGFIGFSITLATLLGVYKDFLSTIHLAPRQIPLILGNLRIELVQERAAFKRMTRDIRDDPLCLRSRKVERAARGDAGKEEPPGYDGWVKGVARRGCICCTRRWRRSGRISRVWRGRFSCGVEAGRRRSGRGIIGRRRMSMRRGIRIVLLMLGGEEASLGVGRRVEAIGR